MSIDLEHMSLDQLKAHRATVDEMIEKYVEKRKNDARAAAEAAAKQFGLSIAELFDFSTSDVAKAKRAYKPRGDGEGAPKAKGDAMYRHAENGALTWTGKGRPPGWLVEAEAKGKQRSEFLIK